MLLYKLRATLRLMVRFYVVEYAVYRLQYVRFFGVLFGRCVVVYRVAKSEGYGALGYKLV